MWPTTSTRRRLEVVVEGVPRGLVLAVGRVVAEQRERARLRLDVGAAVDARPCRASWFLMKVVVISDGLLGRRTGRPDVRRVLCDVLLRRRERRTGRCRGSSSAASSVWKLRACGGPPITANTPSAAAWSASALAATSSVLVPLPVDVHELDLAAVELVRCRVDVGVVLVRLRRLRRAGRTAPRPAEHAS